MNNNKLDLIFSALSDATRRGIMVQLAGGHSNVSQLAEPYNMSQPAISKHLRVLERAGLIRRTKQGRENYVEAIPAPAKEACSWISYYADFWTQKFEAVDHYLKNKKENP